METKKSAKIQLYVLLSFFVYSLVHAPFEVNTYCMLHSRYPGSYFINPLPCGSLATFYLTALGLKRLTKESDIDSTTTPSPPCRGQCVQSHVIKSVWPNRTTADISRAHSLDQRLHNMKRRSPIQGGINWILPKEIIANMFFWDSHWLKIWLNHLFPSPSNLTKKLISLYATKWRECVYGCSSSIKEPVLCPVQNIEQSKCIQLIIETNMQLML